MIDKTTETEDLTQQEEASLTQETENETWQEELPPEDDFQNQDDLQEELIEDIIPVPENDLAAQPGRSGKGILIVVLLIGAALIGGLAYFQFSGSKSGDEQERLIPISSQINIKEIRDAARQAKADPKMKEASVTEATGKVDMTALFHEAQEQAAHQGAALPLKDNQPPAPTEKPGSVEKNSEIMSSSSVEVVPSPLPPPPALVGAPAFKGDKEPSVAAKKEDVQSLPQVKTEVPPPALTGGAAQNVASFADAQVKTLQGQIETLKGDLSKAAAANAQLAERIEALSKTTAAAQDSDALKKRVVELEQKLATQETEISKAKPSHAMKQNVANKAVASDAASPATVVADPLAMGHEEIVKEKPAKVTVKKTVKKAGSSKKKAMEEKTAPVTSWVLRAATPEAAWVSTTRDGTELRRITTGESIPGIGKVKEIRQIGEKWEVIGEKGSIK